MDFQLEEIGKRLKELREICDLSREAMARELEIDVETYRNYEKGKADFSISFLHKAANILGVDILDIMSGETPKLSICTIVKKGKGFSVNRNMDYSYKHLAYTFRSKKVDPFFVKIDPSDAVPVLHEHDGQEFNYVLSGSMLLYIGDICYELNEGDSAYFDSSISHAQKNPGNVPTEFIAIVIPDKK